MSTEINLAVNDREELIYLLTEAAEFEHTVMCTYLYAQWSLKRDESEGITCEEKDAIGRWRTSIRSVALEEMLHLTLVNNLLAAIGSGEAISRRKSIFTWRLSMNSPLNISCSSSDPRASTSKTASAFTTNPITSAWCAPTC
jgi:hypothetical protein